jgi:hypothetical protein
MREELRNGSSEGIVLRGSSSGHKALSAIVACVVALLLIILPNVL